MNTAAMKIKQIASEMQLTSPSSLDIRIIIHMNGLGVKERPVG